MQTLELTNTVRSLFSSRAATFILANIQLARTQIAPHLPNRHDHSAEHLVRWRLDREHSQLASRVFYDTQAPDPEQWLMLDITIPLSPGDVLGEVPEEHRTFILRDNTVWTLGNLAVHDSELYDGLDITLTQEAFERVRTKRMQIAAEGGAL